MQLKMVKPPLRIAVLECDTPLEGTRKKYGGYGGCFTALLESAVEALDQPDLISRKHGLDITTWDVVEEQVYPELEDIDAVLITGSRFNSFDSDPWILKLVEFTRSLLLDQSRVRVIGVCFGHQIAGRALSAPVGRSPAGWEASVSPVTLTPLGSTLFHLPDTSKTSNGVKTTTLFLHQMHRDAVLSYPTTTLAGSKVESLGRSDRCEIQGMYVKDRLITVQGHPEFNEGIVRELLISRHGLGVFGDEAFGEMMERVGKTQDGVVVAVGFLKFLLED